MAQKNRLELDSHDRRIYTTTDSIQTCLVDKYFNKFRHELEVNEVIYILNGGRRQKVIVTQIHPYVTTTLHEDAGLRDAITEIQLGIIPNPSNPEFIMTVQNNTLNANVSAVTGITVLQSITVVDSTTTPALTDSGWNPGWPLTYTLPDWGAHTYYRYYYDGNNIIQVNPTSVQSDNATVPGLVLQANATANPTQITDLSVIAGSDPQTQIKYTFSSSTSVDSATLSYDLYDGNTLVAANVTPDAQTELSSLTPGKKYNFSVWVYVTDNPARVSVSNIQTLTMTTAGTITAFTLTDPATDATNPLVATFTVSDAAMDEWIWVVGNATVPSSNDSGWTTLPTPTTTTLDMSAYGAGNYTIYAYARDASFPTSISPAFTATVTLSVTGTGAVISWGASTETKKEEGSPTETFTIQRTGDTSGASTVVVTAVPSADDNPATSGLHFQPLSSTVSFSAAATTATVDLDLLWTDLGHNSGVPNYVNVDLVLSSPSSGDALGGITSNRIRIEGTNGYWADGNMDVFNPPVDLISASSVAITANGQTISGYKINATGLLTAINASSFTNITIENNEIYGSRTSLIELINCADVTVRNNYLHDSNSDQTGVAQRGSALWTQDNSGYTGSQNMHFLNNRVERTSGGYILNLFKGTNGGVKCNYNFFKDPKSPVTPLTGQLFQIAYGNKPGIEVFGNSMSLSTNDPNQVRTNDFINFFGSGGTSASPAKIECNALFGKNTDTNTGWGVLIGDANGSGGYTEARYNTVCSVANGGVAIAGGRNQIMEYNDCYNSETDGEGPNAQAVMVWRQGGAPGTCYNCTVQYNHYRWWRAGSTVGLFKPTTGNDSPTRLAPNHGQTTEQNVVGWDGTQTNVNESSWDNGVGDLLLRKAKWTLNQPAYADGIYIRYASYDCAVGNGTLTYNNTNNTLTFAEFGDTAGTAVDLSVPEEGSSDSWHIYSGNGSFIRVYVYASASLPASDTVYTVKVTKFARDEIGIYAGPTGEWTGSTSAPAPTDTTPPTVPGGVTATGINSTTIRIDVTTASTDAGTGLGGYTVYRDGVKVGDTPTLPYDDTVANGTTHTYELSAYDKASPRNDSAKSQSVTGTASAPTNLLTNGEFPTDGSGWTQSGMTGSVSGGVITITNSGSAAGIMNQTVTVTSSTTYTIVVKHQGSFDAPSSGYRTGYLSVNAGSSFAWPGSLLSKTLNDSSSTESTYTFTTGASDTQVTVGIAVNDATAGSKTDFDYVRLT